MTGGTQGTQTDSHRFTDDRWYTTYTDRPTQVHRWQVVHKVLHRQTKRILVLRLSMIQKTGSQTYRWQITTNYLIAASWSITLSDNLSDSAEYRRDEWLDLVDLLQDASQFQPCRPRCLSHYEHLTSSTAETVATSNSNIPVILCKVTLTCAVILS